MSRSSSGSGVSLRTCLDVISSASRQRSSWSNSAPGKNGNSSVKRPAVRSSYESPLCRCHHVPWYSLVPGELISGPPDRLLSTKARTTARRGPPADPHRRAASSFPSRCSNTIPYRAIPGRRALSHVLCLWLHRPILLLFQHGHPYPCRPQDNRNIIAFLESLRRGGRNIHCRTSVRIPCDSLDGKDSSDCATMLRYIARYFERFISHAFIDLDGEQ